MVSGPTTALPPLRLPSGGEAFSPSERAEEFARHLGLALGVPSHPDFDVSFEKVERDVAEDTDLDQVRADEDEAGDSSDVTRPIGTPEVFRRLQCKAPGSDGMFTDLLMAPP